MCKIASTLSTIAFGPQTGTFCRNYKIQGAASDTAAESVTIALTNLGLANATDASARMFWSRIDLDGTSVAGAWYEVSRTATALVLARVQAATSSANLIIQTEVLHSIIF